MMLDNKYILFNYNNQLMLGKLEKMMLIKIKNILHQMKKQQKTFISKLYHYTHHYIFCCGN